MNPKLFLLLPALALAGIALFVPVPAPAGEATLPSGYKVLAPIRHGNLTVFPVVAARSHDTEEFLTLDEGLRSGDVIVTESGSVQPLMRRRRITPTPSGAQVNQLVLVNNSKRPLILLAGEIVTGGKQDRVIGKDRIIPAESDPVDLGVFCVEPGRWTGSSDRFGVGGSAGMMQAPMAAPNVRARAMADKDQQKVWSEVAKSAASRCALMVPAPSAAPVSGTSSYARRDAERGSKTPGRFCGRAHPAKLPEPDPTAARSECGGRGGGGEWPDGLGGYFRQHQSSGKILAQAGAVVRGRGGCDPHQRSRRADIQQAQEFLNHLDGRHETVDSEPGLYRHTEIAGDGFRAFELTSLLPKTGFDLHVAKMAE